MCRRCVPLDLLCVLQVMATVLRKGTLELLNKNPRLVAFPRVRLANGAMRVRFTPDPLV